MFVFTKARTKRAFQNYGKFVRAHTWSVVSPALGTLFGLPWLRLLAPGADMNQEFWLNLTLSVVGPCALIIVAFVWYYWRSSGEIYAEQLAESRSLRDQLARLEAGNPLDGDPRMSFPELVDFADQECGWQIKDGSTYQALDLQEWLIDAAGLGRIKFYGRHNPHNWSATNKISPREILPSHWLDHELVVFDAIYFRNASSAYSKPMNDKNQRQVYCDIHVERGQAKRCLIADGQRWRGRNATRKEEQRQSNDAFDAMFNSIDELPAHQSREGIVEEKQP
jgi:hypothetical protein